MNLQPSTFNLQPFIGLRRLFWWMMALFIGSVGSKAQSPAPAFSSSGNTITRYYAAPHFKQMQMKLTGDKIAPLPGEDKRLRATKPEFWAFQETGELMITLRTRECILDESDAKARTLNSTEQLEATTGDGRFQLQGRGFLWQHNQKLLTISNDVRAVIQWTNNAPPLVITSRWFEFDAAHQRGIFHDDVQGEDTNQVFTCGQLAIHASTNKALQNPLAAKGTNRATFDLIEADGGLVITGKARPGNAQAQRGSFRQADQRVDLAGDAVWNFNGYSGNADQITAWMVNTNIEANGNVRLSMPSGALGAASGLLSATNAPTKTPGTNIVTLFADHFTRRGEQLLAQGAVKINDGTNQLTCDRLEGKQDTLKPSNDFAIATGNVFVGRDGGGIYSDRADYSKATSQILFTGNSRPRFQQGEINGTAGRVIARTATQEVLAEDGVTVTFPLAAGSGSLLDLLPSDQTNRTAKAEQPDQKVNITARTFQLQDRVAVFAGDVVARQLPADGSEPRMFCAELEVRLAEDKKHAESLQARQKVVCERGIVGVTNGPSEKIYTRMECETLTANTHPTTRELLDLIAGGGVRVQQADGEARGERAVYTHADQLLKLLGQSVIDRPEVIYTSSKGLDYNLITKQVGGNYDSIRFKPAALKQVEESQKLQH